TANRNCAGVSYEPFRLIVRGGTSALNPQTTDSILQLLQRINEEYNITIMIITHEISIIQKVCNRVAGMEDGKIIETGNVLDVFGNLEQASTKNFVRTVIQDEIPKNIKTNLTPIPGNRYKCFAPDKFMRVKIPSSTKKTGKHKNYISLNNLLHISDGTIPFASTVPSFFT